MPILIFIPVANLKEHPLVPRLAVRWRTPSLYVELKSFVLFCFNGRPGKQIEIATPRREHPISWDIAHIQKQKFLYPTPYCTSLSGLRKRGGKGESSPLVAFARTLSPEVNANIVLSLHHIQFHRCPGHTLGYFCLLPIGPSSFTELDLI